MPSNPLSPSSTTTVARAFVTGMLAGLHRRGIAAEPLLEATGIDIADPASRVPIERYAALYNRVNAELADEGFGLFSQALPLGSFEFLCRSILSSPTLGVALERACRYLRIVLPDLAVDVRTDRLFAQLRIRESRPLADQREDPGRIFAFEWLLRLLHGLACWLLDRRITLDEVTFPYARPAHADDYILVFTEHAQFDGEELRATFPAALLEQPIRRDEAALTVFLDGAPGKLTTLYRRERELTLRVRALLRTALPGSPGQADVAARLFLSARTLHRRLADEGTSFRQIKEALRRDLALTRLSRNTQPIADIAADLGYADPSAFYRACVAWTGQSPQAYRHQYENRENSTETT